MRWWTVVLATGVACGRVGFDSPSPEPLDAAPSDARSATLERWVAPSGSDDAPGTEDSPWRTLAYAALQARPGMTINVEDGAYAGFSLETSGAIDAPIAFRAAGAAAVLNSTVTLSGTSHVTVTGLVVRGAIADGIALEVGDQMSTGVVLRDNRIENVGGDGIEIRGTLDCVILENTIINPSETGMQIVPVGGTVTLKRNEVVDAGSVGLLLDNRLAAVSVELDGNRVLSADEEAFRQLGGRVAAVNNVFLDRVFIATDLGVLLVNNTVRLAVGAVVLRLELSPSAVLLNNVFVGAVGAIAVSVEDPSAQITAANNGVIDSFFLGGALTLAEWEAQTGSTGSVLMSIQGVSASDGQPVATMPTVDVGAASVGTTSAPSIDIDAVGRPQGNGYDIGAHER